MKEPKSAPQATDVERWIAEARQGNRAALDQLFGICLPYLRTTAQQHLSAALRSRLDADDVVQETLIEACRDFPHFQGKTEQSLFAWLRQILHNNLSNEHCRHIAIMRSVRSEVSLNKEVLNQLDDTAPSDGKSPAKQVQIQEQSEAVEQALQQLPEHYRRVLLLRIWEELTFTQIGERLHCSAEAARKLWGRATKEFALVLGDADPLS